MICFHVFYCSLDNITTHQDFTKILLLAIIYAPFMPLIYFFCALIFMIQFWMDKFLLLVSLSWFISLLSHTKANMARLSLTVLQRSWSKAPRLGTETARFSRKYFTTIAVVLGSISSAYAYFQSPFTQLCDCSEDESCAVSDTSFQDVLLLNGTTISSIETSSNQAVKFYNHYIRPFPPVPDRQGPVSWMNYGQEWLSKLTCNLSVVVVYVL
jgi:hypothetical protein